MWGTAMVRGRGDYDPLPAFWVGFFTVGVSAVTPSLGVNGFVPGVVMNGGVSPHRLICDGSKPPLGGTTPGAEYFYKIRTYKPIATKPT
jgi:hypothetical protein